MRIRAHVRMYTYKNMYEKVTDCTCIDSPTLQTYHCHWMVLTKPIKSQVKCSDNSPRTTGEEEGGTD